MPYSKVTLYGIAIKSIEDYTIAQVEENKKMEDLSVNLQDVVNKISEIGINNGDKDNQGEQIEKKYIEDKLIARYDGIENTREGHKDNTTIWEDISGNNRDLIMYNSGITKTVLWEEDGLVNVEESAMCLKTNLIPELQTLKSETIEIVLYCTKDGTSVSRDVINTISANYQPWSGAGVNLLQNQLLEVYNHDNGGTVIPKAYNFDNCKKGERFDLILNRIWNVFNHTTTFISQLRWNISTHTSYRCTSATSFLWRKYHFKYYRSHIFNSQSIYRV